MAPLLPGRSAVVVTDRTVAGLHLEPVLAALREAGVACSELIVEAGERSKDLATLGAMLESILGRGIERSTALVALGGGVVGDLTGFAASILLRGVPFVQIPTTLLAQVDSGVGGKTGVNSAHGKNLIGSFYQPRLVLADVATLATLPLRERRAGYAEIVKYGLIDDARLLRLAGGEGRGADRGRRGPAAQRRGPRLPGQGAHRRRRRARKRQPRPAQPRPHLRPRARGRGRLRRIAPARRGGGLRHRAGPPPLGPARPLRAPTMRPGSRPTSPPSGCRARPARCPPQAGTRRR